MSSYDVRANRWAHGWELEVPGLGITQSRTLSDAERMIRDYLALDLGDVEAIAAEINIVPVVAGREINLAKVRKMQADAERMQGKAAAAARDVARQLHQLGASGADIARVMGVSAQRVSQLLKDVNRPRV